MKQNAIEWPKTIVTDARNVYDNVSTEKGGLPQQKALTLELTTIREWLVNSGAQIRRTADENMTSERPDEGPHRVKVRRGD